MFNFALFIARRHRRTFHAAFAVTLFISYYNLEDKPDDAELPEIRIVVVERDTSEVFVTAA